MADLSADARRDAVAALERAAARAWPPLESAPLQGWQLRYGGARSRRLNSVATRQFEPGGDVRTAIDAAAAWYAERGLPPCFQLAEGALPGGLDGRLAARGYQRITPTSVMTAPADALAGASGAPAPELGAELTPELLAALCDPGWPAPVREERAALYARIPEPRRFALARIDGQPAAAGLCVLDGELAGIFSMRTQRAFRRRGLGTGLVGALVDWARDAGARSFYLQVEDDNPALPLYQRLGFEAVYAYHYRELASA